MTRGRRQTGYALLMVLLVLVIAVTSLAAISRARSQAALRARSLQTDLQFRWGAMTCSELIFADPAGVLRGGASSPAGADKPTARAARILSFDLSGLTFKLVLSDEACKINPNFLMRTCGKDRSESLLQTAQAGLAQPLAVNLADLPDSRDLPPQLPGGYVSFDQVFAPHRPGELLDPSSPTGPTNCPAGRITCWSGGVVNFRTADSNVLQAALAAVDLTSRADSVAAFAANNPNCTLDQLIAKLNLDDSQAHRLRSALTDRSNCYSLWIIAGNGAAGSGIGRKSYQLRIARTGGAGPARQEQIFQW